MADLKCPWRTIKTIKTVEPNQCDWNYDEVKVEIVEFLECLKSECPFWMHGKYTSPVCYRAMSECGRG